MRIIYNIYSNLKTVKIMALTSEEKKQHQLEANRRYNAKRGFYTPARKNAQYKYLRKIGVLKPIDQNVESI